MRPIKVKIVLINVSKSPAVIDSQICQMPNSTTIKAVRENNREMGKNRIKGSAFLSDIDKLVNIV